MTGSLIARACLGQQDGILAPNKVQILVDGELLPQGEFLMVISTSLTRLFAGMRPFWGTGPGAVRLTAVTSDAGRFATSFLGIMRGRPRPFVNEESGYMSRNASRVEMRFDCGFTVDGELITPDPSCVISMTADNTVQFVRA